jgi:hypothetical protein
MTGHGAKFGRKQEQAITALLTQRNVDEAAKATGITAKTLWRWLQLAEFQQAYQKARRQAFAQSIARLQQASSAAATTLLKIMVDPNAPPSTRVRAAECVINQGLRATGIEDLEVRIAALERSAEQSRR